MFGQVVQSEASFKKMENNTEGPHLETFLYNEICPISFSAECLFPKNLAACHEIKFSNRTIEKQSLPTEVSLQFHLSAAYFTFVQ